MEWPTYEDWLNSIEYGTTYTDCFEPGINVNHPLFMYYCPPLN